MITAKIKLEEMVTTERMINVTKSTNVNSTITGRTTTNRYAQYKGYSTTNRNIQELITKVLSLTKEATTNSSFTKERSTTKIGSLTKEATTNSSFTKECSLTKNMTSHVVVAASIACLVCPKYFIFARGEAVSLL